MAWISVAEIVDLHIYQLPRDDVWQMKVSGKLSYDRQKMLTV